MIILAIMMRLRLGVVVVLLAASAILFISSAAHHNAANHLQILYRAKSILTEVNHSLRHTEIFSYGQTSKVDGIRLCNLHMIQHALRLREVIDTFCTYSLQETDASKRIPRKDILTNDDWLFFGRGGFYTLPL